MQRDFLNTIDLHIPLIVDLDGTLSKTDTLYEGVISSLLKNPKKIGFLITALFGGKSHFKQALTETGEQDASSFCYRQDLIALLQHEKNKGRSIFLVTASHQSIADAVQAYLGLFDGVKGSDEAINLKGENKLAWLRENFPQGFIYAGDHKADLPIWKSSQAAVLVGSGTKFAKDINESGIPYCILSDEKTSYLKQWLRQLRIHQWAKNSLIFIPLFLAHTASDLQSLLRTICAFFAFSLIASSTYIINDLADLEADRRHKTKRFRPLAAGSISVLQGIIGGVLLFAIGAAISLNLSVTLSGCIAIYTILTLAYSFKLKRIPMLDVAIIGALFTLRIIMGSVLNHLPLSPWLNSFSALMFFSLALAKRHVEILRTDPGMVGKIGGRGYHHQDWPLTLSFGVASSVCSIVIMLLFLTQEAMVSANYPSHTWLLVEPACVFLWILRIWFLSHRKVLTDDPVIFAIKDKTSIVLGLLVVLGFVLASY
ncbi:TPA: UbiA family prenyltransferase [Escherichia coli]|uniref:UbiA family prenyltransferase n=2 Tax=Escherichia coli TaxID=562 RepID=UPI0019CF7F87|nr:UbiA family prenyltransferase [Escherichia coli]EKR7174322.1 UbiA family prenyltransferase [Escherichia coli]MBN6692604.1 UbiA family prenyltransferase [Escherichia coli]MDP4344691.1 UbiA family prenyltransferase [Escherichia coli]MDP4370780.1 UbiA family prenyltransferase [Escherichia coli]HCN1811239.1 UbiA family prenyltransferase [Escherichia coli]